MIAPINFSALRRYAWRSWSAWVMIPTLVCGCALSPSGKTIPPQEKFGSDDTFSRLYDASPGQTCEAGRRALLSQGYVISSASAELVEGKKNFQPDAETHLQMTIRVVCAPDSNDEKVSLAFVTANQDRFALKKANSSASLGVSALGSVSLPFSSSTDSLVRVGSETIAATHFYESLFELISRYLNKDTP